MSSIIAAPSSWPEVVGISAGACRADGGRFRQKAHAHNGRREPCLGWICVLADPLGSLGLRRYGLLAPMSGDYTAQVISPSRLLWHEYAHILTPGHGHDDAWRRQMRELGQPLPKQYGKKTREAEGEA